MPKSLGAIEAVRGHAKNKLVDGRFEELLHGFSHAIWVTSLATAKYRRWKYSDTFTNPIITGTSTSGPITAAKAAPELMPNTATATAIANSKLLLAAVNASVAVLP